MIPLLAFFLAFPSEADIKKADIFSPEIRVAIHIEIVPASQLTMELTPAIGGGAWLLAEHREGGSVQTLSSWVPTGSKLVAVEDQLAVIWPANHERIVVANK